MKIKVNRLSQKQASYSGTCPLQDLKSPTPGLSPLRFLETCKLSPDKTVEDTIADEGPELHSASEEKQTVSTCSLSNGVVDVHSAELPHKRPKIVCQEAIVEFTVEIHGNSSSDI